MNFLTPYINTVTDYNNIYLCKAERSFLHHEDHLFKIRISEGS